MIEFKNVSKVYDNGSVALDDVCLTINDGEFVLVCGHSGAGKSTLFKLLTHEVVPDAGRSEERRVGKECGSRGSPDR